MTVSSIIDVGLGAVILVTAAALILAPPNPRPKPEVPEQVAQTVVESTDARPDTVRVEPLPPGVTQQRKVDQIAREVREASEEVQALKDELKLKKAIEGLPQE